MSFEVHSIDSFVIINMAEIQMLGQRLEFASIRDENYDTNTAGQQKKVSMH